MPELSSLGSHTKLLLAIYSYFTEAEREYISLRTRQGLAAAKASGKKLGRSKGSRNRKRVLDAYREQIADYLRIPLELSAIRKIINNQIGRDVSYNTYQYYVQSEEDLDQLWKQQKSASPLPSQ